MNRISPTPWLAILVLALPACDAAGDAEPQSASAAAAVTRAAAVLVDQSIQRQGCEVLTEDLVRSVIGEELDAIRQISMGGTCVYTWEGGEARLMSLSVLDDAASAASRFDMTYRVVSEEEASHAEAALASELERQEEAGELAADDAELARGLGGMIAQMAATQRLEAVQGVGDRAVYDGTVRTLSLPVIGETVTAESQAAVLLGNAIFTVEANLWSPASRDEQKAGPPAEARAQNREVTLALARAVVERLAGL